MLTSPAAGNQTPLMGITIVIPMVTVSEANTHTHWRERQKRAKAQREIVGIALCMFRDKVPPLPAVVTLTRLSPRELDSDNAAGALKHVRDGVADFMGVDDGDKRYTWIVAQEKSKEIGVRIEIVEAPRA